MAAETSHFAGNLAALQAPAQEAGDITNHRPAGYRLAAPAGRTLS